MKVYVAGPVFTPEDRSRIRVVAERLRNAGHEPYTTSGSGEPHGATERHPEDAAALAAGSGGRDPASAPSDNRQAAPAGREAAPEDHRGHEGPEESFRANVEALGTVDALVALVEGMDVPSDTAFEVGFAHARAIPIVALRSDRRVLGPDAPLGLMLSESADLFVHEPRGVDAAWGRVMGFLSQPKRVESDTLVRDKVPTILRGEGRNVSIRRVEGIEYARYLKRRIVLEAQALLGANEADEKDEAADLLEALSALQDLRKWAPESLRRVKASRSDTYGSYRLGYVMAASRSEGMG